MRGTWLVLPAALLCASGAQAQQADVNCAPDLTRLSGWTGIWLAEDLGSDVNGRELPGAPPFAVGMKLAGLEAPWNDEGWGRMEQMVVDQRLPHGWGYPVMMSAPTPLTFVVAPSQTVIVDDYRDIRYVFTDGRPHKPEEERWPTIYGDSIGCWKGDTLVVDTVGVHYLPEFNPFAPPLSDNAHFVERLRLAGPDRLESDITITDPEALEQPWTVHMVYNRHEFLDRLVHEGDVLQNNRVVFRNGVITIAGADEEVPTEASALIPAPALSAERVALSTAELDRVAGKYLLDGQPVDFTFERRGQWMLLRVDPVQPFFVPIHPTGPLDYAIGQVTFNFTADESGAVTGFTGIGPDGVPMKATRKPD